MEIDVTHMLDDLNEMPLLSGSPAELGDNAGTLTWNNSKEYGKHHPLLQTNDQRDAARKHFLEYGAWSRKEIEAWSEEELQGIACQEVAAVIRELRGDQDSRLFQDDNGRWYFVFD